MGGGGVQRRPEHRQSWTIYLGGSSISPIGKWCYNSGCPSGARPPDYVIYIAACFIAIENEAFESNFVSQIEGFKIRFFKRPTRGESLGGVKIE